MEENSLKASLDEKASAAENDDEDDFELSELESMVNNNLAISEIPVKKLLKQLQRQKQEIAAKTAEIYDVSRKRLFLEGLPQATKAAGQTVKPSLNTGHLAANSAVIFDVSRSHFSAANLPEGPANKPSKLLAGKLTFFTEEELKHYRRELLDDCVHLLSRAHDVDVASECFLTDGNKADLITVLQESGLPKFGEEVKHPTILKGRRNAEEEAAADINNLMKLELLGQVLDALLVMHNYFGVVHPIMSLSTYEHTVLCWLPQTDEYLQAVKVSSTLTTSENEVAEAIIPTLQRTNETVNEEGKESLHVSDINAKASAVEAATKGPPVGDHTTHPASTTVNGDGRVIHVSQAYSRTDVVPALLGLMKKALESPVQPVKLVPNLLFVGSKGTVQPRKFICYQEDRYSWTREVGFVPAIPKDSKEVPLPSPPWLLSVGPVDKNLERTEHFYVLKFFSRGGDGVSRLVCTTSGRVFVAKMFSPSYNMDLVREEVLRWSQCYHIPCVPMVMYHHPTIVMPYVITCTADGAWPDERSIFHEFGENIRYGDNVCNAMKTAITPRDALQQAAAKLAAVRIVHEDIKWEHVGLYPMMSGKGDVKLIPILIDLTRFKVAASELEAKAEMNQMIGRLL
jgi:hypothetical protein